MFSISKASAPALPDSSIRREFLRPVANRVASYEASTPESNRPVKRATSSTVTAPRSFDAVPDSPTDASSRARSCTSVSRMPDTFVTRCPVMYSDRSTACAPMSLSAPEPACSFCSRHVSGASSSLNQSCRYAARTCRTAPIGRAATMSRANATAGTRRYVNPTIAKTPLACARSAAAAICSASATELASGFSHSTCLPALRAAIAIWACESPGVTISTMSISSRSTAARQSVDVSDHPHLFAAATAPAAFRPTTSANSAAPLNTCPPVCGFFGPPPLVPRTPRPRRVPTDKQGELGHRGQVEEARRNAPSLRVRSTHEPVTDHCDTKSGCVAHVLAPWVKGYGAGPAVSRIVSVDGGSVAGMPRGHANHRASMLSCTVRQHTICPHRAARTSTLREPQLLEGDGSASLFESSLCLLLPLFLLTLHHHLLPPPESGLRRAVNNGLRLAETERGELTDNLDDLDLLVASSLENDVE